MAGCPLLAQSGHPLVRCTCLLLGGEADIAAGTIQCLLKAAQTTSILSDYPILISPKRLRNPNCLIKTGPTEGLRFMWHPISTAPFDRDLELGVIDSRRSAGNSLSVPSCSWRLDQDRNRDARCCPPDALARVVYRRERGLLAARLRALPSSVNRG